MSLSALLQKKKCLLFDGGIGSMLLSSGLAPGKSPESWNLSQPETIHSIHHRYLKAGAEVLTTNTFGGNPVRLAHFGLEKEIAHVNIKGVEIAKEAAGQKAKVCASVGPLGTLFKPHGPLTPRQATALFKKQIKALASAKPDCILIETMSALEEARCALDAATAIYNGSLGITFTFTSSPRGFFTTFGVTPKQAIETAEEYGVAFTGSNCTLGISEMVKLARKMRALTKLPLLFQPNAGQPQLKRGRIRYPETPAFFAQQLPRLQRAGANWIGGCCGTTPRHIQALKQALLPTKQGAL